MSVMLKINLGCGLDAPAGWVNIDNSPNARLAKRPFLRYLAHKAGLLSDMQYQILWPQNIVTLDVCNGLPYADSSASVVYCSMLIAEMPLQDGRELFREVYRILAPGGVFRVLTSDLRAFAREYLDALEAVNRAPRDVAPATRFLRRVGLGHERGLTRLERLAKGSADRRSRQWVYDEDSLRASLAEVGFQCETRGFRESRIADIAEVERHDFTDVVCLECTK